MKISKANLFDLLGRPAAQAPSDGTYITCTPETLDDDGLLPSIADFGTDMTFVGGETYDDDGLLPSIADVGTYSTKSGGETYDEDAVLPLL